jgi:hypothetical protein
MKKKKQAKIQVRLDDELARALVTQVEAAKEANPDIGTCAVVRMLLREALAARNGRTISVGDQAFIEGFMKGCGQAQSAVQTALHSASQNRRSA